MENKLYARYTNYYPKESIMSGLQDVGGLMQSIDSHSYTVPRSYKKIYQTQEVLDADYY